MAFSLFMSSLSFSPSPTAQMANTGLPISAGSASAPLQNSPVGDLLIAVNDLSYSNSEDDDDNWNESSDNTEELNSSNSSNDYVSKLDSMENDLVAYHDEDEPIGCGPAARRCAPSVRHYQPKARRCALKARRCEPRPVKRCCQPKARRCAPVVRHCAPRPVKRQCAPTVRHCAPVGCGRPAPHRCAPRAVKRQCAPTVRHCGPVGCGRPAPHRCAPRSYEENNDDDLDVVEPNYGRHDVRGEELERPMPRPRPNLESPELPVEESYASPRGSTISSQQSVRGLW